MKKVYQDAKSALEGLTFDDMTVMSGQASASVASPKT